MIEIGQRTGYEGDHLSVAQMAGFEAYLIPKVNLDIAPAAITQCLKKSLAEIE